MAERVTVYRIEGRDHITALMQRIHGLDTKIRGGIVNTTTKMKGMSAPVTKLKHEFASVESPVKRLQSSVGGLDRRINTMGGGFKRLFSGLRGQMAGLLAFLSVRSGFRLFMDVKTEASNLTESLNKSKVVFGEYFNDVQKFAKGADKQVGLSQSKAFAAASGIAGLFKSAGLDLQRASKLGVDGVKLAADLASFHNMSVEEAIESLSAGLKGESEPLRRFNVLMNDQMLKRKALEMGLIKSTKGTLDPAIRAQAAFKLVVDQSTDALGDFQRTSKDTANAERILAAQYENVKARLGQALIPAYTKLINKLQSVTDWILANPEKFDRWIESGINGIEQFVKKIGTMITQAVDWYQTNREEITLWVDRIRSLAEVLKTIQLGIIGTVIKAIGGIIELFSQARKAVLDFKEWSRTNNPFVWLIDQIDKIFPGFEERFKSAMKSTFMWAMDHVFKPIAELIERIFGFKILPDAPKNRYSGVAQARRDALLPPGLSGNAGSGRYKGVAGQRKIRREDIFRKSDTSGIDANGESTGSSSNLSSSRASSNRSVIDKATDVTGGGNIKHITITIGNLVEQFIINTNNMMKSPEMVKAEMTRVLLSAVNDVNNSQ